MPDYIVFRAVAPPSFNMAQYQAHSSEPIRYDVVTVVTADSPEDAVNAVIAATGTVALGFAACEVTLHGFKSKMSLGDSGQLQASSKVAQLETDNNAKMDKLEKDLEELRRLSED